MSTEGEWPERRVGADGALCVEISRWVHMEKDFFTWEQSGVVCGARTRMFSWRGVVSMWTFNRSHCTLKTFASYNSWTTSDPHHDACAISTRRVHDPSTLVGRAVPRPVERCGCWWRRGVLPSGERSHMPWTQARVKDAIYLMICLV